MEMQGLQNHLRRRSLRVRHQRRHHCQGHHEPSQEAQGGARPGSSGGARGEEEGQKGEKSQEGLIRILFKLQSFYMHNSITIRVDFGGGLDLVFDGRREIVLQLPAESKVQAVISQLACKHANHKKEMFAVNEKILPGILVLINDADWELFEREESLLEHKDKVSFISTLHGG